MSSTNVSSVLSQLLSEMKSISGRISTLEPLVSAKPSGPAPAAAKSAKKEKKAKSADSEPRAPTAWRLFADRVRGVLREAGFEGKSLGTECVQFCSALKAENADLDSWSESDILARRAAWAAPEVSKQKASGKTWRKSSTGSAASVVSEAEAEAEDKPKKARKNPWEGLSPEEKAERVAKMKAGKAAKKAAEAPSAESADGGAAAESESEAAPASVTSSEKKKRGPKKFSEMSAEEVADAKAKRAEAKAKKEVKGGGAAAAAAKVPLPPSPPSSVSGMEGFQRVMLSGAAYWVNLSSGHCYNRLADGSQGDWAGIFSRTPKPHIDSSVTEPGAEEDEVLNFDE